MYARKLRIKLRPNSTMEFRHLLTERVIPLLRTQKGFQDQITLSTSRRNEAIAISFWDSEETADAYNHVGDLDFLRALSKVIETVPIVENFEIIDATGGSLAGAISVELSGDSRLLND
ncbi:MAG: antibiotic biosynthesis monooxygenase family protein [Chloroflexota bacterium]